MNYIPLYIVLPLSAGIIIPIIGRWIKSISSILVNLVLAFLLALTIYLMLYGDSLLVYKVGGWGIVQGVPIGIFLVLDGLSRLLLLIITLIGFFAVLYSVSYIKKFTSEEKYFSLFSLMIAGMNGVVLSGDLFSIFVFLEIAAIASYALVAFGLCKEELEASFKYQVMDRISSMMILLGIGIIYWKYGTLNIADIGRLMLMGFDGKAVHFVQALFLMGFGLKAALVPFHSWLPDAHSSAPSPISSMLSGVLIKTIGVYVIIRLFFNMFILEYKICFVLTTIGALSMVIAGFLAIKQWDFKRLLAYSSISQIGCIVISLSVGMLLIARGGDASIAAFSILGGLFHLFNHAIFKGLLFLTAGSVEYQTDTRDMRQLGGLSSNMHITTTSALTGSMAISGIPPLNGFFSKLIIIIALMKAKYYILAITAIIIGIITLAYFLKFLRYTFFGKLKSNWNNVKESPILMRISMMILAILCILTSLLFVPGLREKILSPAVQVLLEMGNYSINILSK